MSDPFEDAAEELYAGPAEDFLARRAALATRSSAGGDPGVAKRIAALRKPTLAAAVVNHAVHADPDSIGRLLECGERLRAAQDELDAAALRELTLQRRRLVDELTRAALDRAGRRATPALRDEVGQTYDAAVADPSVAQRLGRLTRPERWSGFGPADGDGAGPGLTLVRGGKDRPAPPAGAARERAPTPDPATARRTRRTLTRAQGAFAAADSALDKAHRAEDDAVARLDALSARLAETQHELAQAKQAVDAARRELRASRARRREARSALDRAERQSQR